MSNQFIHALYDDDDVLLNAVKEIREHKHHIEEIYTPFPVHGLDKAMGLEGTRIAIMAFKPVEGSLQNKTCSCPMVSICTRGGGD